MLKPNKNRTIIETSLNESAGTPLTFTIIDKNSVKNVKLETKPITTPIGFCFPTPLAEDKIIGNNGKIQGESTVTTPAKNAKPNIKNINKK